ncbi:sodium/panthothenate symporter [Anaerohalosphaera lusitana]|uniref:Sodium/panthothenate symporter n=1 Tax=Anaerohalosphaera lusitana TaxID=1936003 RepID=A0A1U9NQ02_9BACT|nr:sodium:solute symporter [Anaerohalosphaera lusitana]AQT69804.1 sodium/panthothenate symporter [Anaerohalosphaera lusitana]
MSTLLTPIDYILIAGYFIILMGIGVYLQKKASNSIEDYFIGGRRLPGWLLGIAGFTQFVDITGTAVIISFLYMLGPKGMLIELRGGLAIHMAVVLIWAGKWHRRSGCITGAEWMIFRFGNGPDGKAARIITAIAMQIFTIGMVIYLAKGVGIFFSTFLPYSPQACSLVVILIACAYTAASGFYGVVFTDLFQGLIIIAAVLVVSVLAIQKTWFDPNFPGLATSISGVQEWTSSVPHWKVDMPEGYGNYNFLTLMAMFYLLKSVINGLGGGGEPKYFGARNDRECGTLTFLWTSLMAFRWPMMIGFAVLGIYFVHQNIPDTALLAEAEMMIKNTFTTVTHQQWEHTVSEIIKHPTEYPQLVTQLRDLLGSTWPEQIRLTSFHGTINPERILPVVIMNAIPIGLKGLLLIALTSACMSTFDGNVNWAVGLITRDLYQGFFRPNASTKELIRISWLGTVAIGLIGYFMAFTVKNINDIWGWLMMALGTGFFVPSAIKFYWERYNGWGFTIGMAMGVGSAIVQRIFWPDMSELWQFVLTGSLSLAGSIIGTLATRPMDQNILYNFYMKTKPFGLWPNLKQKLDPQTRKKVSREHFFDIISLPFVLAWHYLILLVPVLLVIGNFKEFVGAGIILAFALGGMYLFWYRQLPRENFYEDTEAYDAELAVNKDNDQWGQTGVGKDDDSNKKKFL